MVEYLQNVRSENLFLRQDRKHLKFVHHLQNVYGFGFILHKGLLTLFRANSGSYNESFCA